MRRITDEQILARLQRRHSDNGHSRHRRRMEDITVNQPCTTPHCSQPAVVHHDGRAWCVQHWATRPRQTTPATEPLPATRWATACDLDALLRRVEVLEQAIAQRTADS